MRYDPDIHHRRSIRLAGFDYGLPGAYFVTVCTYQRTILFDDPQTKRAVELALLSVGRYCWPTSIREFVVMPNHVHAIIWMSRNRNVGAQHTPKTMPRSANNDNLLTDPRNVDPRAAPLRARPRVEPGSLGAVVRAFKSTSAKRVNAIRKTSGAPVW